MLNTKMLRDAQICVALLLLLMVVWYRRGKVFVFIADKLPISCQYSAGIELSLGRTNNSCEQLQYIATSF